MESRQPVCDNCFSLLEWPHEDRCLQAGYAPNKLCGRPRKTHPVYHFVGDHAGTVRMKVGFYSRKCAFACRFCAIARSSSRADVSPSDLTEQFRHAMKAHARYLTLIRLLALDNSGSILDQRTFPRMALEEILLAAKEVVPQAQIQLESRADLVDFAYFDDLVRLVGSPIGLQLGLESRNDAIRNKVLGKKLRIDAFETAFTGVARRGGALSVFTMVKTVPGMTDDEAEDEAIDTCSYLTHLARRHDVNMVIRPCAMHAVPGTAWGDEAIAQGWRPPTLAVLARVAKYVLGEGVRCVLGLSEEGESPLALTFWQYPETTLGIYTGLLEVNHTQSLPSLNDIIARYGEYLDPRPAEEKFLSFAQPIPKAETCSPSDEPR